MIKPLDIEDDNWEIIVAAAGGDAPTVRRLLEGDPTLGRRGYFYTPPIHFAVREGHAEIVQMLLDAGADAEWSGYHGKSLIDMARDRGHDAVAATLERARARQGGTSRAATPEDHPLQLAAEAGDLGRVRELLDADPHLLSRQDLAGGTPLRRAVLTTAVEFGHEAIARFLLDRGANPTWPELNADKGGSLHAAARAGNRAMVELLLSVGADPNGHRDSAGNAVYAAKTPEIRALLEAHGGSLDPYDLVWKDEDDEVMRRVTADPKSAELGCGGCTHRSRHARQARFAEASVGWRYSRAADRYRMPIVFDGAARHVSYAVGKWDESGHLQLADANHAASVLQGRRQRPPRQRLTRMCGALARRGSEHVGQR